MESTTKEMILELLKKVKRDGIEKFIDWLTESDFFVAPCSTKYHLNRAGGLAIHSYNVYRILVAKAKMYKLDVPEESIILTSLAHDICKVNFYKTEQKWRKDDNNRWEPYDAYVVDDLFPLGHGEKSVYLLSQFIKLTNEEALAIRWHMGFSDANTYPQQQALQNAMKYHPLVCLLHTADLEACYIVENEEGVTK